MQKEAVWFADGGRSSDDLWGTVDCPIKAGGATAARAEPEWPLRWGIYLHVI